MGKMVRRRKKNHAKY
uniref:Uncharacterized protein n=1 Tax=Flavobacterium psychrophilum TaxID=96345 RepID=Q7WRZ1_FLAPS|nr:hypothetical protein [Flavobacterium psychrophilum]BAC76961.1 hypothetical protein [Flavobacterium psychrophilum]BAC76962.1 hypothetical protein [Flavobacterium psychrophilum]BAC76963.1 hypothetical protein [Flavobacterium psychrophilum]BAC76964.1 hypothetical protein [Flavobacterium psychrophilum]